MRVRHVLSINYTYELCLNLVNTVLRTKTVLWFYLYTLQYRRRNTYVWILFIVDLIVLKIIKQLTNKLTHLSQHVS